MTENGNRSPLYTIIVVFFFWGFIAASNGVFIPFCKTNFMLSQFQSQLIDFTFYGGYFVGSLALFLYSRFSGIDFLNRIGFKKGIIYGLLISALGALAIIPSVNIGSYASILLSYFIVALGFSLQQTSSQPFVIALGSPETGAHRLNLAGGINSFGTTLGPIVISYFLFGSIEGTGQASLGAISKLYVIVAILFAAIALFFAFSKLPDVKNNDTIEPGSGALKYPQLVLGMVAIFVYVGVEVSIQSNLGALLNLPDFGGYNESQISPFISLYWGSLMIGRWTGAISVFNLKGFKKIMAGAVVPLIAFGVVLFVNSLHGMNVNNLYLYIIPIALMILINLAATDKQATSMLLFSVFGLAAMCVGLFTSGSVAIFAFLSGGLACSVLWPCIFSLAINGLGKYTSQGSAFLIMMIVGGAVIPPIQGLAADSPSIGIHGSYFIPALCFGYLAWFGWKMRPSVPKPIASH